LSCFPTTPTPGLPETQLAQSKHDLAIKPTR
jgi:hypothetical protein